jgi:hypothetical protein
MIPKADITPTVPSPLPAGGMPRKDEISDEGFGYFRGTWFMGRVLLAEAQSIVLEEAEIMQWLDETASNSENFELLTSAIEHQDTGLLPDSLATTAVTKGLSKFISEDPDDEPDWGPLDGLEIGVAGLAYALSAVGCLTAASCRWHINPHSWADTPVVFFAAPDWRVELLAPLIAAEQCGLDADRNMLTIYAASIRDTHGLAKCILAERRRFRKKPAHLETQASSDHTGRSDAASV